MSSLPWYQNLLGTATDVEVTRVLELALSSGSTSPLHQLCTELSEDFRGPVGHWAALVEEFHPPVQDIWEANYSD